MQEKTLVLIKPDALQRGLTGKILERFEQKGLKVVGMKMIHANDELLDEHYSHHKDKPFFKELKEFMQSAPVIALALEGFEAVDAVRLITGSTNSREADAGTIRGDFSMSIQSNVVHASESSEIAKDEIERFFEKDELFEYGRCDYQVIYSTERERE